ncbi:hypothetical protein [Streptomyces sp. PT12]|uniref:hypothetical protein n=1 Tax=Streptomyces sp. PT12 TaxID=1510197 RepID=UPI000DE2CCCA|nr:hypothetical protein [Streptomyces sp. PT12]RBM18544.1 hypothetical protein DEH69_12700 [Streptomyces sp. PT12]
MTLERGLHLAAPRGQLVEGAPPSPARPVPAPGVSRHTAATVAAAISGRHSTTPRVGLTETGEGAPFVTRPL